jgi:hypothetical protein
MALGGNPQDAAVPANTYTRIMTPPHVIRLRARFSTILDRAPHLIRFLPIPWDPPVRIALPLPLPLPLT